MWKGSVTVAIATLLLVSGAANAQADRAEIEQTWPYGGQLFQATKAEGNAAFVRVKFLCPEYTTDDGEPVRSGDYSVIFERRGRRYAYFTKQASFSDNGRCSVVHPFGPGNWSWQVWIDKDQNHSPRSNFLVDSAEKPLPDVVCLNYGSGSFSYRQRPNRCDYYNATAPESPPIGAAIYPTRKVHWKRWSRTSAAGRGQYHVTGGWLPAKIRLSRVRSVCGARVFTGIQAKLKLPGSGWTKGWGRRLPIKSCS